MKWIAFLIFLPCAALAQGFAGLGTDADGFSVPERGKTFDFPTDHAAHESYRIEWWYLTANLTDENGTPYGLQWTLFRSALGTHSAEGWDKPQLWMGHAAVTTPHDHFSTERLARGGIGQAGVTIDDRFNAWIDDWAMAGTTDLAALTLSATGTEFAYEVTLNTVSPLVFHGEDGYSVKSGAGQASYYYSQPFYDLTGTLALPSGDVKVTGQAWLDREWSSQPLAKDQTGWDWFSLSFDSGARMMGFVLRSKGETSNYTSATWIEADGTTTALPDGAFKAQALAFSEIAQRDMPTSWALELPQKDLSVTVEALNTQAWMNTSIPYWEGPISVAGSHSGRGYLEMTGY